MVCTDSLLVLLATAKENSNFVINDVDVCSHHNFVVIISNFGH